MTREVKIGNVKIGANNKIAIQSMTNTETNDKEKTLAQIIALQNAGADIVRFTVNNSECTKNIRYFKDNTRVPLVADIHFDYKLAILAAENGIDKLRINPGNIGSEQNVKKVADCAKAHNIPIRIGVNSGSVEKDLLEKYHSPTPYALCESAMRHVRLLEKYSFDNIVISIKASNVKNTILANRQLSSMCSYPLHIGVTEAGLDEMGLIKSAVGIGSLLIDGIGATVRVSLTGDPTKEVYAAKNILQSIGMDNGGYIEIVSCPTCGRTTGDLEGVVRDVKNRLKDLTPKKHIKIAIMGCVVNGPGEAKEADLGIAFAKDGAVAFLNGKVSYSGARNEVLNWFYEACKRECEKE